MPPAIVFLLLMVNDRQIMGKHANSPIENFFGISVTVLLVLAGLFYGVTSIFPHLLPT